MRTKPKKSKKPKPSAKSRERTARRNAAKVKASVIAAAKKLKALADENHRAAERAAIATEAARVAAEISRRAAEKAAREVAELEKKNHGFFRWF